MKTITCESGKTFMVVTRWIHVKTLYNITKRHALYDYSTDGSGYRPTESGFNPIYRPCVDIVEFTNEYGYKTRIPTTEIYLLESMFMSSSNEYFTEKGKNHCISAVDMYTNIYDPYYLEFDDYGEKVRVFKQI